MERRGAPETATARSAPETATPAGPAPRPAGGEKPTELEPTEDE